MDVKCPNIYCVKRSYSGNCSDYNTSNGSDLQWVKECFALKLYKKAHKSKPKTKK